MRVWSVLLVVFLLFVAFSAAGDKSFNDDDVDDIDDEFISTSVDEEEFEAPPQSQDPKDRRKSQPLDDEEFEGFEEPQQPKVEEIIFQKPISQPNKLTFPELKIENFYFEIGISFIFLIYGINYWYGRKKNSDIAKAWFKVNWDLFQKNFFYLGDGKGHYLIKDSPSDYIFYASGRNHCKSLTGYIELRKRHDLVSLIQEFALPMHDKITIEVEMNNAEMEKFFFAVYPKKTFNSIKKDNYDLETFGKPKDHPLHENLIVCGDCSEVINLILKNNVPQIIKQNINLFDGMKFTDQPKLKPIKPGDEYPKILQFEFRLPDINQMDQIVPLQELVIYFIDYVAEQMALTREARNKVERNRKGADAALVKELLGDKQEALEKKKAEKLKEQKEEFAKMTPEQQKKWEAKQYQKDLKKRNQSRVKVLKA